MMGIDEIIWQSAQNILRAQENLDKLFNAFRLVETMDSDLAIVEASADAAEEDFLKPVWNLYFFVKRSDRANAKTEGVLTLAIQLTSDEGDEADWKHGKRAKALIGYSAGRSLEDAWEFDSDAPNAAGYCRNWLAKARHWAIQDEDVDDPSWFYALPLDRLTNATAVRDLIVAPVREILRGGKVDDVLAKIEEALCPPPQA
jgi:hypothetical protein